MSEFFNMGGYAMYVWSSFGITFLIILLNLLQPLLQHRKALREAEEHFAEKQ